MRNLFLYLIFALLTIILPACHDAGDEPIDTPDEPQEIVEAKRTILIYMVADNSLGTNLNDLFDLNEMVEAVRECGLNDCRVIAYHHARGEAPVLKELSFQGFLPLKTYDYDTSNYSVDPERMEQVIADCRAVAPAESYGLVLWSHGNGWIETATSRSATEESPQRAFGDDRGRHMKITTLASVLNGKGFDWIYFDCCHMATVEILYELRHAAPVIVGSPSELPADGMDYTLTLPIFLSDEADMTAAADATFNLYNNMTGSARTCTMSVVNTAALDDVASATQAIMAAAPDGPTRSQVQRYMTSNCTVYDLGHYIDQLQEVDPALIEAWHAALDRAILYKAATPYLWNIIKINNFSGLGTWVIESEADTTYKGYNNLSWWTDVVSLNPKFTNF